MKVKQMMSVDEKAYNKLKNRERFKKNKTLFIAKLLKRKLKKDDTRTIQQHRDNGGAVDYYISSPYLQNSEAFSSVVSIIEDKKNQRFVYRGIVQGADNAIGIIETNVPLAEIVASPYGNVKLEEMLSVENAMQTCMQYYEKNGLRKEPLEGHKTHFSNANFILGTILKDKNGKYSFDSKIKDDIEQMLEEERKKEEIIDNMRIKEAVEVDLGNGLLIANQDCWLEQGQSIKFAGINSEALFYEYTPLKIVSIENGKYYMQIGDLQIGKSSVDKSQIENTPLKFHKPYIYSNVVLWTEGKKLIQYIFEKYTNGINLVLGETFNTQHLSEIIEKKKKQAIEQEETPIFLGGIRLNEDKECEKLDVVPNIIKEEAKKYLTKMESKSGKIINFER